MLLMAQMRYEQGSVLESGYAVATSLAGLLRSWSLHLGLPSMRCGEPCQRALAGQTQVSEG